MLWMWMRRKSSRCKPGDHAQSDREDCMAARAPFEPFAAFIIIGERAAHEAARAGATPPRAAFSIASQRLTDCRVNGSRRAEGRGRRPPCRASAFRTRRRSKVEYMDLYRAACIADELRTMRFRRGPLD